MIIRIFIDFEKASDTLYLGFLPIFYTDIINIYTFEHKNLEPRTYQTEAILKFKNRFYHNFFFDTLEIVHKDHPFMKIIRTVREVVSSSFKVIYSCQLDLMFLEKGI